MAETEKPIDRKQLREGAERAATSGYRFKAATVLALLDALDAAELVSRKMATLAAERLENVACDACPVGKRACDKQPGSCADMLLSHARAQE